MRTSSNETDEDDYHSSKTLNKFRSKNNFQHNQHHLKRERNSPEKLTESVSLVPVKKKLKICNNSNNVSDEEHNSLNTVNNLIENGTIDQTYLNPIRGGKFFKLGCSLNVTEETDKKLLKFKTLHKSLRLPCKKYNSPISNNSTQFNKYIIKNGNSIDRENLNTSVKENANIISNSQNLKSSSINNNRNIWLNQNRQLSKLSLNIGGKKKNVLGNNTDIITLYSRKNNITENKFCQKTKKKNTIHKPTNINILETDFTGIPKIPKLSKDMSVYDRRYPSDERSTNGIIPRVTSHNDENTNSLSNQYYTSSALSNTGNSNSVVQPTIATLCNIGNTCYLNSVVYTLRFAPLFLHNLHHLIDDLSSIHQNIGKYRTKSSSLGRNVTGQHMENGRSWSSKDLATLENNSGNNCAVKNNTGNINSFCEIPKSNQQIATEKLHELYQSLHKNEVNDSTEAFHADTFLHAIQDVSAIFEGNQQQDAHEFLMCVLNNIRETCQSLIKSISECPDVISNGYVSLPDQKDIPAIEATSKDQLIQTTSNSTNNISQATSLLKSSFFSRKSKRKDETKTSKNFRVQSPLKDNALTGGFSASTDIADASKTILNTNSNTAQSKGSINSSSTDKEETELSSQDKEQRLADKIKKLGLNFFTEDFEGITVSTTKCLSCETVTEQKETMIDIAVPISGYENADFTETSHSFIQNSCVTREYFVSENKYRCEQCIGYTEAIRSISYEVLPRLLVIQLSRFSGGMEKINSYLPTPFTLQCFCSKCYKSSDEDKLHIYKLYSVITHVGATMSVGHYIAYTCSLDLPNEYVDCPKDRKRQQQQQQQQQTNLSKASNTPANSLTNGSNHNGIEKNVGLMKKMFYGRNKASSSGDMSKSVKTVNNIGNKDITNGVEKIKLNSSDGGGDKTICPGANCCGTNLKPTTPNPLSNNTNPVVSGLYNTSHGTNGTAYADGLDDLHSTAHQNTGSAGGYNSSNFNHGLPNYNNGVGANPSNQSNRNARSQGQNHEPTWYMCDDDKIKAMTQREFEEILSPNRKIMITPYLLFYARKTFNNGKQGAASSTDADGANE